MARKRTIDLDRKILLTYLESIQLDTGGYEAEDFFELGTDFSSLSSVKDPETRKHDPTAILNSKFSYNPDPQNRRNGDSGWVLKSSQKETEWSKIAYRIGVREIGLSSFEYDTISECVTKPISSVKPIYKISLDTEELIPSFYDPMQTWIEYHVSIDDGKSWRQINPIKNNIKFDKSGKTIPRVLTIKSSEEESEDLQSFNSNKDIYSVRVRYLIKANDSGYSSSPVLKLSRVMLYSKDTLSGST